MQYIVYENRRNGRAIIHRTTCGELYKHGGNARDPYTQEYHGPFDTLAEAESRALALGRRFVKRCSKPRCLDGTVLRQ